MEQTAALKDANDMWSGEDLTTRKRGAHETAAMTASLHRIIDSFLSATPNKQKSFHKC